MSSNQIEYHRKEAQLIYKEVERLEQELRDTSAQHKRQSLKHQIELKRAQWQVQNLHRQNEELKANAEAVLMTGKVKEAKRSKEYAEKTIKETALTQARRWAEMADKLQKYAEAGNTEYMLYTMLNDAPVTLGNSSMDSLSRYRAELHAADQILAMAKVSESE